MAGLRIHWFDDGIAEIDCPCGQELMIHQRTAEEALDRCEACGRQFRLVQHIDVVEPAEVPVSG